MDFKSWRLYNGYSTAGRQPPMSDKHIILSFALVYIVVYRGVNQCFSRGVRGHAPPPPRENSFKWCNLVRFGVYLDQILSLKIF